LISLGCLGVVESAVVLLYDNYCHVCIYVLFILQQFIVRRVVLDDGTVDFEEDVVVLLAQMGVVEDEFDFVVASVLTTDLVWADLEFMSGRHVV